MLKRRNKTIVDVDGTKAAAGDNYGVGTKAKIGKVRSGTVGYVPVSKKKLKTPPRNTS